MKRKVKPLSPSKCINNMSASRLWCRLIFLVMIGQVIFVDTVVDFFGEASYMMSRVLCIINNTVAVFC